MLGKWLRRRRGASPPPGDDADKTRAPGTAPCQGHGFDPLAVVMWDLRRLPPSRPEDAIENRLFVAESVGLHGDPAAALSLLRGASPHAPPPLALMTRAWLGFLQGSVLDVRRDAIRAMRELPADDRRTLAALRCAWIHLSTWEIDVVREALAVLHKSQPIGAWATFARLVECSLLALSSRREDATAKLQPLVEQARTSGSAAELYHLAVGLSDVGLPRPALDVIGRALRLAAVPDTGQALLWLEAARAFSIVGLRQESLQSYTVVAQTWPGIRLSKAQDLLSDHAPGQEALVALMEHIGT